MSELQANHPLSQAQALIDRVAELGDARSRLFTCFEPARILAAAEAVRILNNASTSLPLAGLVVTLKDLFDEQGQRTTAGSMLLQGCPEALQDSIVVSRLMQAGALIGGRTTMSEFAYSGVGLNPHYETHGSVYDASLIPGGSTSGGALSVALGLVDVAIGTDTGGSVRIPAAVNGLYGFKPSQQHIPRDGVHPLAPTYDTVGPLARELSTLVRVYRVLSQSSLAECAGTPVVAPAGSAGGPLRIAIPVGAFTNDIDQHVDELFAQACQAVREAGHALTTIDLSFLEQASGANRVIVAVEAHAQYRSRLVELEQCGDPRVLQRIRVAETLSEQQILQAYTLRSGAVAQFAEALADVDVLMAPTLCMKPPTLCEAEHDFDRVNAAMLRNCALVNLADGCALSMPLSVNPGQHLAGAVAGDNERAGRAIMLVAANGCDEDVLSAALTLDPVIGTALSEH